MLFLLLFTLISTAVASQPMIGSYVGDDVNLALGYKLQHIKGSVHPGEKLTLEIHSSWLSINCRGNGKHDSQAFSVHKNKIHLVNDKNSNCIRDWARKEKVHISKITYDSKNIHIHLRKKITFFYSVKKTITLHLK
jgi:hypothetical protein